ncbi:hypothetical protein, partial [Rhizobium sp. Root1212]|uniref:hypothetical protein n=1 Tax=Rhizobium sp. Root1212 TaxID=1736429 RepID=UPI001AECCFD0
MTKAIWMRVDYDGTALWRLVKKAKGPPRSGGCCRFRRGGAWGFHREAGGHQLDTEQKRKKLPDAY